MNTSHSGIWKAGHGKGRKTPKGRQLNEVAVIEVDSLIDSNSPRRDLLIEYLHLIQDKFRCISPDHMRALAEKLNISMAEVHEVASFYAHFDVLKDGQAAPPEITIRVCDSLSCEIAGSAELKSELEREFDQSKVRVLRAPCMGRCNTAPTLEIGHAHIDNADIEKVRAAVKSRKFSPDIPDYETFHAYIENGGYRTLRNLRENGDWEEVQSSITSSGLRGLGGAGFPSGKKWIRAC